MADNQLINFNSQDVADMYRRNQYARMLQEQANAPIERPSYKGIEAPLNATQGAAKMAAALLAGYQYSSANESYAKEKAAAEQKMVAEQERRRAEVSDYQKGFDPVTAYMNAPGGDVNDYSPQTQTTLTPRSRGEMLAHAMRGAVSDNPQVANMGRMQYEQQNAMAQDEARVARDEITRKDMLAGREQTQSNADRSYKLDVARMGQDRNKQPPAPAGYRFTPTGDLMAIPGGPVDAKTIKANSAQETGRDTVSSVVDQLRTGYENLNARNAIVNAKNSLMSNLSAGIASSEPGQAVSNLAGTEAQSIRNEIKMTRPLLLQQIMKATGMSAKQMDSNAELKLWLSTATNPGVDIRANLAALDNIEKMYGMPKSATPAPTPSGQGATVSNWNK